MKTYTEKIAKGALVALLMSLIATALGYFLRIFLARNLTLVEYGLFYSVLAFLSYFGLLKDMGIGQAIARFLPEYNIRKQGAKIRSAIAYTFCLQAAAGIAIFAFLFFSADYIAANFFHDPAASIVVRIMAVEFLIGFTVLKYIMQGMSRINIYASIEASRTFMIWVFVLIFIPAGLLGVTVSYLTAAVIINLILFFYAAKIYRSYTGKPDDSSAAGDVVKFGLTLFAGTAASMIIASADVLSITYFLSLRDVALYNVALPTSQLLLVFYNALAAVLFPSISEIWSAGRKDMLAKTVSLSVKYLMIFMIPVMFIMLTYPEIIIYTIFGPSYVEAAPLLQILSLAQLCFVPYSVMLLTLIAIGRAKVATKLVLTMAALNVVLNVFLVPYIGVIGAALATLATYLVMYFPATILVRNELEMSLKRWDVAKIILGSALVAAVIFGVKGLIVADAMPEAGLSLLLGFSVYAVLMLGLKVINKDDIRMLVEMNIIPKRLTNFLYKVVK